MCPIASGGLFDVADDVLRLGEIDPVVGAELHNELVLLLAAVDGDDAAAHVLGVLDGKMAKSSTGAGDDNPVSGSCLAVLECAVNGKALMKKTNERWKKRRIECTYSTEDGGSGFTADAVGDGGDRVYV